MADKYDFSAFDKGVEEANKYDLSAFDKGLKSSDVSKLESALRGAGQGATLGFEDELAGAGSAGLELAQGNIGSLDELMEAYSKKRDEERAANKAAEEANPWTYNLSNIAGGMVIPAGAIGNVAKGAGLGAKTLAAAKAGTVGGALAGLGSSEASTVGGNVKDTLTGAAIGGTLGPALVSSGALASKTIKKVEDTLSKAKFPQKVAQAYKSGKIGEDLYGKEAQQNITEGAQNLTKEIVDEFENIQKAAGGLLDKSIKDLPPYNQRDLYDKTTTILDKYKPETGDEKAVISNLEELLTTNKGNLTPKQVDNIKRNIGDLVFQGDLSVENKKIAQDVYYAIKNSILQNLPKDRKELYNIGNKAYEGIVDAKALGKINAEKGSTQAARESVYDMINRLTNKGVETFENPQEPSVVNFEKAFKSASKVNEQLTPVLEAQPLSSSPIDKITELKQKLDKMALKQSTAAGMNKQSPYTHSATQSRTYSGSTPEGSILKMVQTGGEIVGTVGTTLGKATSAVESTLGKITKWINEATPESLQIMGKTLADKGSPYAQQVSNIINQPLQKRKALLFTLSQQPGFREEVRQLFGVENGK